jgi:hypothetical protein
LNEYREKNKVLAFDLANIVKSIFEGENVDEDKIE